MRSNIGSNARPSADHHQIRQAAKTEKPLTARKTATFFLASHPSFYGRAKHQHGLYWCDGPAYTSSKRSLFQRHTSVSFSMTSNWGPPKTFIFPSTELFYLASYLCVFHSETVLEFDLIAYSFFWEPESLASFSQTIAKSGVKFQLIISYFCTHDQSQEIYTKCYLSHRSYQPLTIDMGMILDDNNYKRLQMNSKDTTDW